MLSYLLFALACGVLVFIIVAIGLYYYVLISHMLNTNKRHKKHSGPAKTTNIDVFSAKRVSYERKAF